MKKEDARNEKYDHVYAIIRIDNFEAYPGITDCATVKVVLLDKKLGEAEIERLNKVNHDKGCKYFLQQTRIQRS